MSSGLLMPFEYATLRVVPRVERQEFVNAGVVVYCQRAAFLASAVELDESRLLALSPSVSPSVVRDLLEAVSVVCSGGAAAGQAGATSQGQRFRWLTAPRSTVVQTSPVHSGMTGNPSAEVERLMERLVRMHWPES